MPALDQHKPFDASLVDSTEPYWWHEEVPATWRIPSGEFPLVPVRDKAQEDTDER